MYISRNLFIFLSYLIHSYIIIYSCPIYSYLLCGVSSNVSSLASEFLYLIFIFFFFSQNKVLSLLFMLSKTSAWFPSFFFFCCFTCLCFTYFFSNLCYPLLFAKCWHSFLVPWSVMLYCLFNIFLKMQMFSSLNSPLRTASAIHFGTLHFHVCLSQYIYYFLV